LADRLFSMNHIPRFLEYKNYVSSKSGCSHQTSIEYSTGGFFCYEGQTFTGNQISIVNSSIGKQVTVTIGNGIDTLTNFTLLLPNDNPPILNGPITTVGITINNTFVGVPPLSTTTYVLLIGTATTGS